MSDVFISYAHEDADWVRELAVRLEEAGIRVYFDEWDLDLAMVIVHELDNAIRTTKNAIQVLNSRSVQRPWVREEYAALLNQSLRRGLRFIPVFYGDQAADGELEIPPFVANRVALDFRNASPAQYEAKIAILVRTLRGEPRRRGRTAASATPSDADQAALAAPERPRSESDERPVMLCYAAPDAGYGERLAAELRAEGLPVWSVGDLAPGDDPIWTIRRQLSHAVAVAVLMSPAAQDSDDVTLMILEANRHSRTFFPVLLGEARHYLLANTWYFDGRGGRMPGPPELGLLRRLVDADRAGEPTAAVLPPVVRPAPAPAIHVPAAVALEQLRDCLGRREFEHADLLTTAMLLEAAGRLDSGWIVPTGAGIQSLPIDLLAGVDQLWSRFSAGSYGFAAQRALAEVAGPRHVDFLPLSVRCGWRGSPGDTVAKYQDFVRRDVGQVGFYPTLRNPQAEQYLDWYDQWWQTTVAVHLRLLRS